MSVQCRLVVAGLAWMMVLGGLAESRAASQGRARLDIKVEQNKDKTGGGWDRRSETVELVVHVENKNLTKDYSGLKAVLYGIARDSANTKRYTLIVADKFTFDLAGGKTYTYDKSGLVTLMYDKSGSWRQGYRYYAHVVVIRDVNGQLLKADASQSKWFKYIDNLGKFKVQKDVFNDKCRKVGALHKYTSGMWY